MADTVQSQNLSVSKAPVLIRKITPRGTRTHKGIWLCQCGKQFEASFNNVSRGHTRSCGCFKGNIGTSTKHGHFVGNKPSLTYKSWQSMIARCTNPKHPAYQSYAGLGVTICEQWLRSFPQFLADVGERPEGLTLDRINPYGNYEPGNVRWADRLTQARNQRRFAPLGAS